jgi:hypothetical protein
VRSWPAYYHNWRIDTRVAQLDPRLRAPQLKTRRTETRDPTPPDLERLDGPDTIQSPPARGREEVIRAYRATAPQAPIVYRRGERADAASALPGWSFPVDEIFE